MPIFHQVVSGDHMAAIAAKYGFEDWRTVWSSPDNEPIRQTRNPNVLLPGDQIVIPDRKQKKLTGATGRVHVFRLERSPLRLAFTLQHHDASALASEAMECVISGGENRLFTDDQGSVDFTIEPRLAKATLLARGRSMSAMIGHLDPVDSPSGLDARLANLGYLGAVLEDVDEQERRLAIEELQFESALPVTGVADAATLAKLLELHGA